MNFTSQGFFSQSICEYPTLEEDSSPMKNCPEAKPIIGVKKSLLSLQKAQDQEKWPRNYEVMIQSPEPAKPVLHLPQLEASRFNQLQTRNWRPEINLYIQEVYPEIQKSSTSSYHLPETIGSG
ncbi:hypothetical protein F2Q68_00011261 [Brassica cretica]|uniref:Uncharacterized protein n=1 Tax=Brassica cretica TaxID=69181 RepID=A0A8S9KQ47_BRACR|nr:hypothetical protein F2Q68_00011261 [Brassica cretica]